MSSRLIRIVTHWRILGGRRSGPVPPHGPILIVMQLSGKIGQSIVSPPRLHPEILVNVNHSSL